MAASTAIDSNYKDGCDVFINHRGPDVKNTFASHLYHNLHLYGLRGFLDKEEMRKGENLTTNIKGAIQDASVHVAIFSQRYAESKWCLDELLLMWDSRATIIPVFYGVKPADLRRPEGVYAQALRKLQEQKHLESATIENWRKVLSSVAKISGCELEAFNGDEGKLLGEVIQHVLINVKKSRLKVAKYLTGLDEKVKDIERTLFSQQQIGKPEVVWIVGQNGAGKTTLAIELFNRKISDYSSSCFLYYGRGNANNRSLDLSLDCFRQGTEMRRERVSSAPAFLVLDGVDHDDQVRELLSYIDVLDPNSLVVITSRCEHALLRCVGVPESIIYSVNSLDWQHSQELFCLYAFRQSSPLAGFDYLVDEFTRACYGLPLLLKVFGAFLYGNNSKLQWADLLDELLLVELQDTHIKLNVLYDVLGGQEQQIFLDVACFFIGEDRDSAIKIWNESGWNGSPGFQSLENRCLVEVDNENKIRMQDCLRDMGRDLVKASELPDRLCQVTIDDIMERSSVITGVRGIKMLPVHNHYDGESASFSSWKSQLPDTLQLLHIDGDFPELIGPSTNLIWLLWVRCPYSSLPSWILLKSLRVLKVIGFDLKTLWPHESQAFLQLQELWITAPLSEIPKSIGQLKHLERIHVRNLMGNTLEELPEEFCHLHSLKELALLNCPKIKVLPDSFGNLTNLEHIDLSDSESLQILPDSFRNLIRLKYLDLKGCHNLRISYATIGDIRSLEHLNLSACEKINVLPVEVTYQRVLKELYLRGTGLKKLPSAIGDLSNLELLELGSPSLEMLPRSLGDLKSLKYLKLLNCPKLKRLPDTVKLLTHLTDMTVEYCNLRKIEGLCDLAKLEILKIRSCEELEELPSMETLVSLQRLWSDKCVKLKRIKGLAPLTKLRELDVRNCSELEELEGVEHCISLERLYASGCTKLQLSGGARDQLRQRLDIAF